MQSSDLFPKPFTITLTGDMVAHYAAVSGDTNPVHLSDKAANQAGFQKKVAHGMLLMALSTNQMSSMLGATWEVQQQTAKFVAPCYVNEELTVRAKVTKEIDKTKHIKVTGANQQEETILRGEITLRRRT